MDIFYEVGYSGSLASSDTNGKYSIYLCMYKYSMLPGNDWRYNIYIGR